MRRTPREIILGEEHFPPSCFIRSIDKVVPPGKQPPGVSTPRKGPTASSRLIGAKMWQESGHPLHVFAIIRYALKQVEFFQARLDKNP